MAETVGFRTSMRGFHKQDVLNYIDALQAEHAQETAALEQRAQTAEGQLSAAQQEQVSLQSRMEELQTGLQQQTERAEELQRQLEACLAQGEELRLNLQDAQEQKAQLEQRAMEAERFSAEQKEAIEKAADQLNTLQQLNEENARVGGRLAALEAENKRYATMIGDVGAFIMEIRSLGQGFLEAAYKRSEGCLDALDGAVAELEGQLGQAKEAMDGARSTLSDCSTTAGVRLEELVQKLEDTASTLEIPAAEQNETTSTDEPASDADNFFR